MNQLLRLVVFTLLITFAAGSAKVFAQLNYYWTDNGASDNWSDVGNWATRLTGSTDPLQPAIDYPKRTTDNVFFDVVEYNDLGGDINVIIDVLDAACANFDGSKATVNGIENRNFILTGTNAGKLTIAGNYNLSASPAATNSFAGITEFSGTGIINTDVAFSGTILFNNVTGVWTLAAPLTVNNLTLQNGTLDVSTSNHGINITGNWTVLSPAVFNSQDGTVSFDGAESAEIIVPSNVVSFYNLTINKNPGNVNINENPTPSTSRINFVIENNLNILSGGLFDWGNQISNTGTAGTKTLNVGPGANLFIGDDNNITLPTTFPTGFSTITLDQASTIDYRDRTTNQLISAIPIYGNLTLSNAGGTQKIKTIAHPNPAIANPPSIFLRILGNVNIENSITWVDNGYQIEGQVDKAFNMGGNSQLNLGKATVATRFPLNYISANIQLSVLSTVTYNAGVAQSVKGIVGVGYGNIVLSGGSLKTLDDNTIIQNTLNINPGTTLDVSSTNDVNNIRNINIQGNWIGGGNFRARTGTVTFYGTTLSPPQTITSNINISVPNSEPSLNNFYNIVINKQIGGVTLNSSVTVGRDLGNGTVANNVANGSIELTRGVVTIPNTNNSLILNRNTIVVGSDRSVPTEPSGSNPLKLTGGKAPIPLLGDPGSYIDGYMIKKQSIADELFTFPLGNAGSYRPAGMIFNNNNRGDFRARYIRSQPPNYTSVTAPLSISRYEYWDIRRIDGNASIRVVLSWQIPVSGPAGLPNYLPGTSLAAAQGIVVAGSREGGPWEDFQGAMHNVTNTTIDGYSGFLRTPGAAGGGERVYWTLGSTIVGLPVNLLYFQAQLQNEIVKLNWATAQEINNDYFTVERSIDGQNFTEVVQVEGAGTSEVLKQYQATDPQPAAGVSYYRLKQTDLDGKFSYSKVVAINSRQGETVLQAYQPFTGQLQVEYSMPSQETGILQVYDSQGKHVWSKSITSTAGQEKIYLTSARGLYLVTLQSSQGTLVKKVIIY
ncbi:T9SS type A sorting domain-containing protein [Rhodocytophaga aerolata]|uniref:T9SS type A sorting domain-containing protein n=1 Tax=Rhodocytophaga aerolata TaxID=455078 RepID=A0ABT8R9E8_9BACT|nr:T9SS type A sorting domain-containing protein [Rhodocytophaga aerolata]MDO1447310.1 T9SS type A sorting domain-containing protein [Rhodocytophaga aerolata]